MYWLGAVPSISEPDTVFAFDELKNKGVETSLCEECGGQGLPSSFIMTSRETGSRTIVSTRNGVPEVSPAHFASVIKGAFQGAKHQASGSDSLAVGKPAWCHLELRQPLEDALKMAECWLENCQPQSMLSLEAEKPSIDLEKLMPLLRICNLLFLQRVHRGTSNGVDWNTV